MVFRRYRFTLLSLAGLLWCGAGVAHGLEARAVGSRTAALEHDGYTQELLKHLVDDGLLSAALYAGGCQQSETIERCRQRLAGFCREQHAALAHHDTMRIRAERVVQAVFRDMLTSPFQPYCYRVDETLAGTSHNCLTSTILLLIVCRELDLPATAMSLPEHVYCRLWVPEPWDVQTTLPEPMPGRGEPAAALFPRRDGRLSAESDIAYRAGLEDRQLLARICYNRGTCLLVQKEYERAWRHLRVAYQLDARYRPTRHNLIAAGNAHAVALCEEARFAEAASILEQALRVEPDHALTLGHDVHVHHRWVMALCGQQRFDEAWELLERCYERRPEVPFFDQGRDVLRPTQTPADGRAQTRGTPP